ncbi:hypothetical protein MED193_11882 [Roseobacter sp. MED193]|nr:hypothetical protein MED193_11882 [Roseobacter sp. MED193]
MRAGTSLFKGEYTISAPGHICEQAETSIADGLSRS